MPWRAHSHSSRKIMRPAISCPSGLSWELPASARTSLVEVRTPRRSRRAAGPSASARRAASSQNTGARAYQWCASVRECRLNRRPHSLSLPSSQPISGRWISGRSRRPLPRPKQPTTYSPALRVARRYGRARCCVRTAIRTSANRQRTHLSLPRQGTHSRSGVHRDQTRRRPIGDWPGSRSSSQ